jgi:hypothetical protein
VAALVLFIAALYLIRRLFRAHRLGRAEYPPPSPLLPSTHFDDFDSRLPPGIARSMSQRSKASYLSEDTIWEEKVQARNIGIARGGWGTGQGYGDRGANGVEEGYGERAVSPLSPLPPVAKGWGAARDGGRGGGGEKEVVVDGVGFSLIPTVTVELVEAELQGKEMEREKKKLSKIFELSA